MKKTKRAHRSPKTPFSFRRHILPPLLGVVMMGSVLALMNAQWISAQLQYRLISSDPIDYTSLISTRAPSEQPEIIIPKLGVNAPVVYDEQNIDEVSVAAALRKGTYHYPTTAYPGQNGNVAIFGHSSGATWVNNPYKFVFTLLDKLEPGDKIIIDYQGTRYIYEVTESFVVPPTQMSVLDPSTEPILSIITCTPVGTSKDRLVVRAMQISPKAELNTQAEHRVTEATTLPSN